MVVVEGKEEEEISSAGIYSQVSSAAKKRVGCARVYMCVCVSVYVSVYV